MPAAILVIDLVNDTFKHETPLSRAAKEMLPRLNEFLARARRDGHIIIFSTDSFLPGDFIFKGRMKEHSLRDTQGAEIAEGLQRDPSDIWLPKRRFSAFFKTDLDQSLRLWGVRTVGVAGVTTNFCVLATAFDVLSHDFRAVLLEDLSAAGNDEIHQTTINLYRNLPLDPLFRVMTGDGFLQTMKDEESAEV